MLDQFPESFPPPAPPAQPSPQPDPWAPGSPDGVVDLDFLFLDLQEQPDALLLASADTLRLLTALGSTMRDEGANRLFESAIPSAYTYFGQFVDHDAVQEFHPDVFPRLDDPQLAPLSLTDARLRLRNRRHAPLDLDSVYSAQGVWDEHGVMELGAVTPTGRRPPGSGGDDLHDLPRLPRSEIPERDRAARIGAPRNDENLLVAQLTVAFLRAHNELIRRGSTFDQARTALRQHYHWVVIHDFLKRIADPVIVERTLVRPRHYGLANQPFFLPLEFTAAVYRFGHSMVRSFYDYNPLHPRATLGELFSLTAFSGNLALSPEQDFNTLPDDWIIDWQRFAGPSPYNFARRIDTRLVEPLFELPGISGGPLPAGARLAVRNLLRGYQFRMPTGQAVAGAMGLTALTAQEIESVAANPAQLEVLRESGFSGRTPLWFYILAETAFHGKDHLGPMGSTLVAEVLIGLVRKSVDSILSQPGWVPTLGQNGHFGLPDLLRLGGVLPG